MAFKLLELIMDADNIKVAEAVKFKEFLEIGDSSIRKGKFTRQ